MNLSKLPNIDIIKVAGSGSFGIFNDFNKKGYVFEAYDHNRR